MFFPSQNILCHDHRQANIIYKIHVYTHTHTHQKSRNTFRSKSKPMTSPETTNVFVKASNPLTWFPWNKKATKLTSKNSIPDVVNKDKRFQTSSFPGVHSHACVNKDNPILS